MASTAQSWASRKRTRRLLKTCHCVYCVLLVMRVLWNLWEELYTQHLLIEAGSVGNDIPATVQVLANSYSSADAPEVVFHLLIRGL